MEKNKVKVSLDYEVIRKPMYNSYLGTIQNAIVKRMFKMRVNNPTSEVSKAVAQSFFCLHAEKRSGGKNREKHRHCHHPVCERKAENQRPVSSLAALRFIFGFGTSPLRLVPFFVLPSDFNRLYI